MSSFWRPTVPQLIAQIKAGFQALIDGADAALRRSNLAVSSVMMGTAVDGQYGYLDWIIDNTLMPDTALAPYSNRWGAIKGASPKGPAAATGQAAWTGGLALTPIPAGTLLQLQPGVTFKTDADIALDGSGNGTAAITAVLPAVDSDGSLWNCDAGAGLSMVSAIAGVPGAALAVADISNGAPPETNDAFVARYIQLFRQPPQGGDAFDYIEWALEVPGVTRAWCAPLWMGPGTVAVFPMFDVSEAAHSGVPQGTNGVATGESRDVAATGDQLIVANWIYIGRFAAKGACRPATALVYVIAASLAAQNFTLKHVPVSQRTLVQNAISDLLISEGAAVAIDPTTGVVSGGTVELADIQAAVRAVPQCSGALVTSPTDNIATSIGQLPVFGTPTWL